MKLETLLMQLSGELIVLAAVSVPIMLAHSAFRLSFKKENRNSKSANRKSIIIDVVAIILSICELVIGIVVLPHVHCALKWLFAVVDFGILMLTALLETLTAIDYFRNRKKFLKMKIN